MICVYYDNLQYTTHHYYFSCSICKGTCLPGYKFPDDTESMELECSQLNGVWQPYRNFPECVGKLLFHLVHIFADIYIG